MHKLEPSVEQIIREAARAEIIKEFDVKALLGAAGDMVRGLHVDMQNKYLSRARLNAAKKMTAEIDKLIAKYTAEFEKLGGTSDDALYAFATAYRHHAVNHAPAEDSQEATPTQTKEPHPAIAQPAPQTSDVPPAEKPGPEVQNRDPEKNKANLPGEGANAALAQDKRTPEQKEKAERELAAMKARYAPGAQRRQNNTVRLPAAQGQQSQQKKQNNTVPLRRQQ